MPPSLSTRSLTGPRKARSTDAREPPGTSATPFGPTPPRRGAPSCAALLPCWKARSSGSALSHRAQRRRRWPRISHPKSPARLHRGAGPLIAPPGAAVPLPCSPLEKNDALESSRINETEMGSGSQRTRWRPVYVSQVRIRCYEFGLPHWEPLPHTWAHGHPFSIVRTMRGVHQRP